MGTNCDGEKAFMYAAPFAWNELQKDLKLHDMVPLEAFKKMLVDLEADASVCRFEFYPSVSSCVVICLYIF